MSNEEKTIINNPSSNKTQIINAYSEKTQISQSIQCPICKSMNSGFDSYCIDCGYLLSQKADENYDEIEDFGKIISLDGQETFLLQIGENLVGREDCDIFLSDTSVSRRHAIITVNEDKTAFLKDLESTNSSYLNDKKVTNNESLQINNEDFISFGSAKYKYFMPIAQDDNDNVEDTQTNVDVEDKEDLAEVVIGKLTSKDGLQSFDLYVGTYKIGRNSNECDIVLKDSYVSGIHAQLEVSENSLSIVDLGSSNGTFVNNVRLPEGEIKNIFDKDEVKFGSLIFNIEVNQ